MEEKNYKTKCSSAFSISTITEITFVINKRRELLPISFIFIKISSTSDQVLEGDQFLLFLKLYRPIFLKGHKKNVPLFVHNKILTMFDCSLIVNNPTTETYKNEVEHKNGKPTEYK